ncbi:MAG: MobA/MobL family protein [Alphaproteobacteria bacterium]
MPVALLKHHFLRRDGTGPKAHAHAAYLSGTKLDDGYGHTADFTPKGGILHAELWVPKDAPVWAKDRGQLWKRLEAREDKTTRKAKAILAHKFIGALPHELSIDENILFIKDFIREQFTRKGYAADWAIHAPDPGSDSRNFHVHVMVPLRKFENGDWARTKDRFPKNSPALSLYIKEKQGAFFHLQNRYLKKNGFSPQITRSDGKWIIVEQRGVTISTVPIAYAALPAQQAEVRTSSPVTTSQPAPSFGGGKEAQDQRKILGRYTQLIHQQRMINPSTKGWPPGAIRDWELWGKRNPPKFFALWPECVTGNPSPTGGV